MIDPAELRITVYDPQEGRGMRVGVSNGVEAEHLPSGTIARYHGSRAQHRNRAIVLDMLLAAVTHPEFGR